MGDLILIAQNEGEGSVALSRKFKISKSAFSRHVAFLTGHRTVRTDDAPIAANDVPKYVFKRDKGALERRQELFISPEGERLIIHIQKLIEG